MKSQTTMWNSESFLRVALSKYLHTVGHPVFTASGDLLQFVGSSTDITERKRAEEALRQAHADLAHVSRVTTMGELMASLAHEVNQPIAAAVTNANTCVRWLAASTPNLEEARAAAMRIVKDGTRAAEIIKRIRLLFKKAPPEQELVDVNEVIREMIILLRGEATRYKILLRTELAPDLPTILGDRVQLQQVLMNLMMNSIDAMKEVDGIAGASRSSRKPRKASRFWCRSAIPAWVCPRSGGTRSSMRFSLPNLTAPAWDCGSAAPSLNRMVGAYGPPTTFRRACELSFRALPAKMESHGENEDCSAAPGDSRHAP